MKHNQKCIDRRDEMIKEYNEWAEKHPNHCTKCGGAGGHYGREYLGEYWMDSTPYTETCKECIENGKCPLCGKFSIDNDPETDEFLPCANCGYDFYGDTSTPQGWDGGCNCYEDEINEPSTESSIAYEDTF